MAIYEELRSALDTDPGGLRSDQLIHEALWDTLDLLLKPEKGELTAQAAVMSNLAREYFRRSEPGAGTWRLWYAGQIQGLAGLINAQLSRHLTLETAALVLTRKHSRSILEALSVRYMKVSDLAKELKVDESYTLRELAVLAQHNLVETVKQGRVRLARITFIGSKALGEIQDKKAPAGSSPKTAPELDMSKFTNIAPNLSSAWANFELPMVQ